MTTTDNRSLEPPPEILCRIDGVAGILLQEEGRVLISDFPLPPAQTERISLLSRKMCQGFRKARRVLRHVVIGYPVGQVLVISRDDIQLILLLLAEAPLHPALEAAATFLAERLRKPLRLPTPPAP